MVGKDTIDLQTIQLPAELSDLDASLQFLQANRRAAHEYYWYSPDSAADFETEDGKPWPEGQGAWVDEDTMEPPVPAVEMTAGDSVQIDMDKLDGVTFTFAGQVSDADLTYEGRAGFNYVGNPYPTNMSLQNIQLDPELSDLDVSLQFLQANRRSAHEYYWYSPDSAADFEDADGKPWPEGKGAWVDEDTMEPNFEDGVLLPGEAVQVDFDKLDGSEFNIYAPIEL